MKKIAIITPCILPVPALKGGAVEELITKIIDQNELDKNYSIDLFTIEDKGYFKYNYLYTNIITIRKTKIVSIADKLVNKYYRTFNYNSSKRLFDNQIADSFFGVLKEIDGYDAVIIENMMSTAITIIRSIDAYNFPIYFHMHNDVDIYRSQEYITELVRNGVCFIAVSNYIKQQILNCDKNAVVTTLYNGVDLKKYVKSIKEDDEEISFLFAGRIIPNKGVKELVQAFIEVNHKIISDIDISRKSISSSIDVMNVRLDIYGFSGFDKKYERLIKNIAKGHSNIICHDQISSVEMPSIYDKADIVVMPTISEEPFGLVALEAMSLGKPLIVARSGALPEIVADGAYIVDKGDDFCTSLSDAMYKLCKDKQYRKKLSENGYARAHSIQDFDIKKYYFNLSNIIAPQRYDLEELISVVVPVYNVSSYLARCIKSIIVQTYRNIEIILVNDGSTDDSGEICDRMSSQDKRIIVIHQNNQGLSAARNAGIEYSNGKYIFFCDSDDYIVENALEIMLDRLHRDKADIVACGFAQVYDDSTEVRFTDLSARRWNGYESVIQMMRAKNVCSVAWNKLYKKELFSGIRFPLGAENEDEATVYKLLNRARIVSYTPEILYKYFQRDDSIIHENLDERYHYLIKALTDRIEYFQGLCENELEQHSRISLLEWIKYCYRNVNDRTVRKELSDMYRRNISLQNAPTVMGKQKKFALLLWKYIKY